MRGWRDEGGVEQEVAGTSSAGLPARHFDRGQWVAAGWPMRQGEAQENQQPDRQGDRPCGKLNHPARRPGGFLRNIDHRPAERDLATAPAPATTQCSVIRHLVIALEAFSGSIFCEAIRAWRDGPSPRPCRRRVLPRLSCAETSAPRARAASFTAAPRAHKPRPTSAR